VRRPSRHSPAASYPNTRPRAMQAGVASYDNPTGLEAAVSTQVRRLERWVSLRWRTAARGSFLRREALGDRRDRESPLFPSPLGVRAIADRAVTRPTLSASDSGKSGRRHAPRPPPCRAPLESTPLPARALTPELASVEVAAASAGRWPGTLRLDTGTEHQPTSNLATVIGSVDFGLAVFSSTGSGTNGRWRIFNSS